MIRFETGSKTVALNSQEFHAYEIKGTPHLEMESPHLSIPGYVAPTGTKWENTKELREFPKGVLIVDPC